MTFYISGSNDYALFLKDGLTWYLTYTESIFWLDIDFRIFTKVI